MWTCLTVQTTCWALTWCQIGNSGVIIFNIKTRDIHTLKTHFNLGKKIQPLLNSDTTITYTNIEYRTNLNVVETVPVLASTIPILRESHSSRVPFFESPILEQYLFKILYPAFHAVSSFDDLFNTRSRFQGFESLTWNARLIHGRLEMYLHAPDMTVSCVICLTALVHNGSVTPVWQSRRCGLWAGYNYRGPSVPPINVVCY